MTTETLVGNKCYIKRENAPPASRNSKSPTPLLKDLLREERAEGETWLFQCNQTQVGYEYFIAEPRLPLWGTT